MTARVYKYALHFDGCQLLPKGAEPLYVAMQNGEAFLWARVNPDAPMDDGERIVVVGTGHDVHPTAKHIGSFMMHEGALVFHVFDLGAGS